MFRKISKKLAIKMYNENYNITLVASKCRPEGFLACHIKRSDYFNGDAPTLDKYSNEYRYYNCNYETGRAVAFYVESYDYDEYKDSI